MRFPSEKELARLRAKYPPGTRIILDEMDDLQAPPVGTIGKVLWVDDAGQLVMKWESGCGLSLIPNVDKFRIVKADTIIVGKPINGITINGNEYILDDNGHVMKFPNEAAARKFLHNCGFTDKMIEDCGIVFEKTDGGETEND